MTTTSSRPTTTRKTTSSRPIRPDVQARSDWSRHALNFGVGAELARYARRTDNNYQDFFFDATGRLDITRDDVLTGALEFDRLHEDREVARTIPTRVTDITTYYQPVARLGYRHNFARLFTQVGRRHSRG